jgi:hypothetical protein
VQHCENKDTYECGHRDAEQEHIPQAEQRGFEIVAESADRVHCLSQPQSGEVGVVGVSFCVFCGGTTANCHSFAGKMLIPLKRPGMSNPASLDKATETTVSGLEL